MAQPVYIPLLVLDNPGPSHVDGTCKEWANVGAISSGDHGKNVGFKACSGCLSPFSLVCVLTSLFWDICSTICPDTDMSFAGKFRILPICSNLGSRNGLQLGIIFAVSVIKWRSGRSACGGGGEVSWFDCLKGKTVQQQRSTKDWNFILSFMYKCKITIYIYIYIYTV